MVAIQESTVHFALFCATYVLVLIFSLTISTLTCGMIVLFTKEVANFLPQWIFQF